MSVDDVDDADELLIGIERCLDLVDQRNKELEAIVDAANEIIAWHDDNVDINENGNATGAWIRTSDIDALRAAIVKVSR